MKLYIVDSYSDILYGGNTAGVILLESATCFPNKRFMIDTAAELRYSETAFVLGNVHDGFAIRYFTPTDEVELCGHATIGAFGALLDCGGVPGDGRYAIQTVGGDLAVEVHGSSIFLEMPLRHESEVIGDATRLAAIAGAMRIRIDDIGLVPQIVSTGLPDIMLHITSRDALMEMRPDFPALAGLSREYGVIGLHAFALSDGQDMTAVCRNFAPLFGIDEEAATGTSNGALTCYLYRNGVVSAGVENVFSQGENMNRPSRIHTLLSDDERGIRVNVGGRFRIVVRGDLLA